MVYILTLFLVTSLSGFLFKYLRLGLDEEKASLKIYVEKLMIRLKVILPYKQFC